MRLRIAPWFAALALSLPVLAAPAQNASRTTAGQLHDTGAALQQQRAQSEKLRSRVSELEKQSAANRDALMLRDREIAALQRKLDALQAGKGNSTTSPRVALPISGRSGH